jgi:diguanylate cyclase (GGDEF)-like protein
VDIRTILYVNAYLLVGMCVGLRVIAYRYPLFRDLRRLAIAFGMGAASTLLRIADSRIPSLFSIVLANLLLLLGLVVLHHCIVRFVTAATGSRWVEGLLVGGATLGLAYFTYVDRSLEARSLLLSLTCLGLAGLSIVELLRCRDAAVRTPCFATAALYGAFALTAAIRCVGVLCHDTPRQYFTPSVTNLIGLLGFQIIIVGVPLGYFWMSSARLWANQNQLARTDPLTGLPNRRALEEWAARAIEDRRARQTPFAVLVIDIDHFKRINDQYGHKGGDVALRTLAHALVTAVRKEDLVARLGGEEFVILLHNQSMEGTMATAERIRRIIEEMEIQVEDQVLKTTVSSGIAVFEADDTFEVALRRADRALYAAKLAGRNCVMLEPVLTAAN